jgi:3-methyladenine DNA glycosylase AlkD
MGEVDSWVDALRAKFEPQVCPANAIAMRAYMKDVSRFFGLKTPERRALVKAVYSQQPPLTPMIARELALALWEEPEREMQYAACDILARYERHLPASFLTDPVAELVVTNPWWDTVDTLGTAVINPLTLRFPELVDVMWQWNSSGDRWLVRASIQHQRGRKADTNVDLLFDLCEPHVSDPEFFIAKAIGWALRDTSRWFPMEVTEFVDRHSDLSTVARREALRGLQRAGAGDTTEH